MVFNYISTVFSLPSVSSFARVERGFCTVLVANFVGVDKWSTQEGRSTAEVFDLVTSIFEALDECAQQVRMVAVSID